MGKSRTDVGVGVLGGSGGGESWPFKSQSHFSWGGEEIATEEERQPECLPASLPAPLTELAISSQSTDPQYLEDRVLLTHPSSCKSCARCSRGGGGGWVAATV